MLLRLNSLLSRRLLTEMQKFADPVPKFREKAILLYRNIDVGGSLCFLHLKYRITTYYKAPLVEWPEFSCFLHPCRATAAFPSARSRKSHLAFLKQAA